ncbi:MAG: response regulator transcription factor [Legionellaceae bacterium]|nr:response regulator transcription factor [Legionellaceae bacterium]
MLTQKKVLHFIHTHRSNTIGACNFFYKASNGTYIDADLRTAYIAGVDGKEIVHKSDADLRWSHYHEQYQKNDQIAFSQSTPILKIEETINQYGQSASMLCLKQAVADHDGRAVGIFGAALYTDEMAPFELSKILDFIHHALGIGSETSISPLSASPSAIELLTKREKECAHYLCLGMNAREIASQLNLSKRTVETYMAHMKDKLQVNCKSELIRALLAIQSGH